MWILTTFGFFSVVRKPGDVTARTLTVRARAKGDLKNLRARYLPHLGPIRTDALADYRYRAAVPQADLAVALLRIGLDIDYANFKAAVAGRQGPGREALYHRVWAILRELQDRKNRTPAGPARRAPVGTGRPKARRVLRPELPW